VDSPTAHVIQAAEIFTTKNKILRYKNKELCNTIKKEKKRRKRSRLIRLIEKKDLSS
jgi:hypothetical protein